MSVGWGYIPMVPAPASAAAPLAEHIEVVQLITTRATAPSLGDFLAELHNSEVLSDITIRSDDGLAVLKCHKLVLIRWSAPFRRMLCGDMREAREKEITLHGVDGEVLAAFIRFLYTCNCSIAPEKLVGLCAMADQYDVTLLQQLCMDAIRVHVTNHRCCCLFYKAAKEIQQQEIQQLAWEQLSSNLHSLVQQHDVFVQLEFEDVLRLFSRQDVLAGRQQLPADARASSTAGTAAAGRSPAGGALGVAEAAAAVAAEAGELEAEAVAGVDWAQPPADVVVENRRQLMQETLALMSLGGADQAELDQAERQMTQELVNAPVEPLQQQLQRLQQQQLGGPQPATDEQQQQQQAAPPTPPAATYMHTQPRSRPEYALFLASMAWLHHTPERQQYKQQLYACFDFNAMRDNELSQMRRNEFVQSDPELKEMLLDAFERRCLAHAQQPVYNMAPMPRSSCVGWGSGHVGW